MSLPLRFSLRADVTRRFINSDKGRRCRSYPCRGRSIAGMSAATVNISNTAFAWELSVLPDFSHLVLQNESDDLRTPLNGKVTCNCYNLRQADRQLYRKQARDTSAPSAGVRL